MEAYNKTIKTDKMYKTHTFEYPPHSSNATHHQYTTTHQPINNQQGYAHNNHRELERLNRAGDTQVKLQLALKWW